MRLAIARAQMIGHKGIILVGDPEYYARFGFTATPTGNLVMPGPVDRRRFLAHLHRRWETVRHRMAPSVASQPGDSTISAP